MFPYNSHTDKQNPLLKKMQSHLGALMDTSVPWVFFFFFVNNKCCDSTASHVASSKAVPTVKLGPKASVGMASIILTL